MVVLTRLSKNKRTLTWPFLYELQLLEMGDFGILNTTEKGEKALVIRRGGWSEKHNTQRGTYLCITHRRTKNVRWH